MFHSRFGCHGIPGAGHVYGQDEVVVSEPPFAVFGETPAFLEPLRLHHKGEAGEAAASAILAAGTADNWGARIFGFLAVTFAAVNIFGGFLVTRRMLAMFQPKKKG